MLKCSTDRAFLREHTGVTAESVWGWCGTLPWLRHQQELCVCGADVCQSAGDQTTVLYPRVAPLKTEWMFSGDGSETWVSKLIKPDRPTDFHTQQKPDFPKCIHISPFRDLWLQVHCH